MKLQAAFISTALLLFVPSTAFAQTAPTAAPSAAPSATPSASPAASPTPFVVTPKATPVIKPATIDAPVGWSPADMPISFGGFKTDGEWNVPGKAGMVFLAHSPSGGVTDINVFAKVLTAYFTSAAGPKNVHAHAVNVCGGTQKGYYYNVVLTLGAQKVAETIYTTLGEQVYLSEYARPFAMKSDPRALAAISTLCAPK